MLSPFSSPSMPYLPAVLIAEISGIDMTCSEQTFGLVSTVLKERDLNLSSQIPQHFSGLALRTPWPSFQPVCWASVHAAEYCTILADAFCVTLQKYILRGLPTQMKVISCLNYSVMFLCPRLIQSCATPASAVVLWRLPPTPRFDAYCSFASWHCLCSCILVAFLIHYWTATSSLRLAYILHLV